MKLLNNRRFALAVLVVCVLGSVIGLGGAHLAGQRRDVLRIFNDGIDPSFAVRFSMDAYLENSAEYALSMAEEYRLHVDADDTAATEVIELAAMIGDGEDLDARYDAYKALCMKVEGLYTGFHGANVPENDGVLFDHAYSNFKGENSKIGYDEFHTVAEAFNATLEGFPAGLIGKLVGAEPVNAFR